jgi:chemotaxis protein methyltransferase CheR
VLSPELRDIEFEKIRKLVFNISGIDLHEGKKELVKARLGKRLREGKFQSFKEYYEYVTTEQGADELITMIDSISTNLTSFFREDAHFRKLRSLIPSFLNSSSASERIPQLNIWSAGCSTGEEAYSIAITVKESADRNINLRIWATDISTKVLKTAVAGVYPADRVKRIPSELIKKYFAMGQGSWEGYYRTKKNLQDCIEFARFNLMSTPPSSAHFDIIFCRNVMIYFNKKTQSMLVENFHHQLKKGGYLFVGHSESLTGLSHQFKYIEPSVYCK